ncbi:hypothetical protein FKB36_12345 [Methanoculleus sp. Afa-1]|jgi:hypothetical protein|uniref:Uncharacterized protein n=1 Tax=Methanoculleus formosensis TaxID=2590886 RepID=A0A9E4ZM43_9EURY|nr:hypothetical protein [Methanoculleus sp. Afa-1]MCT8338253.1 hypothetical protein [Methanoculleus sp. Afa-1]MDD3857528.1 hypothetical protein [Methanoculleus sp.]
MTHNLTLPGAALISTCIIAGGILIAAQMFAVVIPFAPYVMVALAVLIVIGAAMLIFSDKGREINPSQE